MELIEIVEETILNQTAYNNFVPETTVVRKNSQVGTFLIAGLLIVGGGLILHHYWNKKDEERTR